MTQDSLGHGFEKRVALCLKPLVGLVSLETNVKPNIAKSDSEIDVLIKLSDGRVLIIECKDGSYYYPKKEHLLKLAENARVYQQYHANEKVYALYITSANRQDDFPDLRQYASSKSVGFWSGHDLNLAERILSSVELTSYVFSRLPSIQLTTSTITPVSPTLPQVSQESQTGRLVGNILTRVVVAGKSIVKGIHEENERHRLEESKYRTCGYCHGFGSKGLLGKRCKYCHGKGKIRIRH